MDFRDSPEEAAFRDRLRGWLTEQKGKFPTSGDEYWAKQGEWHQALYAAGFFGTVVAQGVWRPRPSAGLRRHRRRGDRQGGGACPAQPRLPGRRAGPSRQQGTAAAVPARHDQRHRAVVPGLLRARRGLRPGVADHHRHPRGRRVRHPRAQDLDELLRCRRLVSAVGPHRQGCAEAPGHFGVHHLDAPAGHRAATAEDDQRRHEGIRPGLVSTVRGCQPRTWSARRARAGSWR